MELIRWQATVQDQNGNAVVNPSITVRKESGTLATIYTDAGAAKANPFTGNADGFVTFRALPGRYIIEGVSGGQTAPNWIVDLADATREPVPLEAYGAEGDGVASDQTAWNSAIASGKSVYLSAGKTHLLTSAANTLGVNVSGPGYAVTTVPGGLLDWSTPEDRNPVHYRHFLSQVKRQIISGNSLKIAIVGDSTATNGYGLDIAGFVTATVENMGIGVASVVNSAVAGHAWFTQSIADILTGYGEQKDLLIAKFGINDGGSGTIADGLAAMRNAMRTRLAEIRSSTYGAKGSLSILLIMPNALGNTSTQTANKNNLWLKAMRGVYLQAARDFGCAIYDPYAESQWADGEEGLSLDSQLVHPHVNYNYDIWGRALQETLQTFGVTPRNASIWKKSSDGLAPASTSGVALYRRGVSYLRASSGDGWPFSGLLVTEYHIDNICRQTLIDYSRAYPVELTRHWITSANTWSTWNDSASRVTLTLQNSWVDYGGAFGSLSVQRTVDGKVFMAGVIKNGTTAATTTIATLPAGYRPIAEMIIPVATLALPYVGQIRITTAGVISLRIAGDATGMFFDGVCFLGAT